MLTKKIALTSCILLQIISCAYSMEQKKKQELIKRNLTPGGHNQPIVRNIVQNNQHNQNFQSQTSENLKFAVLMGALSCCIWGAMRITEKYKDKNI